MCDIMTGRIVTALSILRAPTLPGEYDLHSLIARALTEAGIPFAHEYKLGPRCRIDFLCENVGIEVKKGRPQPALLTKQISRYLSFDNVRAIVVVTQKAVPLPATVNDRHVTLVSLNRLWGVALP